MKQKIHHHHHALVNSVPKLKTDDVTTPETSSSPVEEAQNVFDSLYAEYPLPVAKAASRTERDLNGFISTTLVYGEIEFESFYALLKHVHLTYSYTGPGATSTFVRQEL